MLYTTSREAAYMDLVRQGVPVDAAEAVNELFGGMLSDARFYLTDNNELITSAEFKDVIEADYNFKLLPIKLQD